ncbi:SDR family NAD(P)-dependent oxidoreductase [Phytoactinopolyspora alkaliphila]|uniref:SDR family NAD(P)-dependent oxidoreductase n=1 Tax=Phytoactinopolyspora alkaliphila TaxID=1783498 RepID=A0A6N9YPB5_9ACTN|nr:SDR family NAD(P)-dependent oxidoreductase [Phytoactinopolyspora alkaliphila]
MTTALITGGTSGIGLAFAHRLAREGYDLVLVARDAERLERTAQQLRADSGVSVETLQADLADRSDVARVAERVSSDDDPVDMLVNNAGFGLHAPLASTNTSVHEVAIDVMCRAVLVLGGAAAQAMASRRHGTIINLSSTAGYVTLGGYSAIKAWVTVYSEGLAVELRDTGVQVTALCPGWVHTEFHQRAGLSTSSIPSLLWTNADHVVDICLRDVRRGKVISIPTRRFRFLMWWARHLPRSAIRAVSARLVSRRRSPLP